MLTALYDGNCVICRSTCETMRALDWLQRIEFINLHEDAAWQDRYPKLAFERLMAEIHVIDDAGSIYAGFAASRRMLREVPLGWPLWLLLQLPGSKTIGRRAYRYIARRRYRINALLGNELPDCADGSCKPLGGSENGSRAHAKYQRPSATAKGGLTRKTLR